ncbi:hypothetical protein BDR05DRAFT_89126 [Suillus weaverae]|nr:hypothetical protein BDR05DRAFT_89126 [Suillus weaverae]
MPGVVVLPSSPSLAGFGSDTPHLPRQPINPPLNSSTMHNGVSSLGSVLEIKEHAKSTAERSKGFSAKALIGSARSQLHLAQSREAAGDPKAALHAFYVAVNLITTYMNHSSYAADRTKGSPIHNDFLQSYQVHSMSLVSSTIQ